MSRLVARILLSIFVFPLGGLLYTVLVVCGEQLTRSMGGGYRSRETMAFAIADGVTWLGVAAYWWLLWFKGVRWTATRVGGTLASAVGAAFLGAIGGIAASASMSGDGSTFGMFVGGVLAIVLWLIATVILWRESAGERAARVGANGSSSIACPTCGYNLTGLREARCPECGSRFALDELLAAQPARIAAADLD